MSITSFAAYIGVSRVALSRVLNEKAAVTPEVSIRISEALGQDSADIWFNIQNDYDCRPPTQSLYAGKLCSCNPPLADIPSRPPI